MFIKGNMTFSAKSFPVRNFALIFSGYIRPFKFLGRGCSAMFASPRPSHLPNNPVVHSPIASLVTFPFMAIFFAIKISIIKVVAFLGTIFSEIVFKSAWFYEKFSAAIKAVSFDFIPFISIGTFFGTKFRLTYFYSLRKRLKFFVTMFAFYNNHFNPLQERNCYEKV